MENENTPLKSSKDGAPRGRGKLIAVLILVALAFAGGWFVHRHVALNSAAGATTQAKQLYTCGMHPQVIQDHPGNCPICGMKLTPMRKQAGAAAAGAADSSAIEVDPVTTQNMGIRTAIVKRAPLRRTIRTVGAIDYDEAALADVTTKFKGWIEKLYVNSTGALVMRGDPLFEIYSPELYSAQVEYLLASPSSGKAGEGSDSFRASSLTKLKLLDISEDQIAELERTRQAKKTLRIMAPQDGFVIDKMVVEGQMVDMGMKIYRLADLGLVWMQAQVYEQDLAYLKLGQEATMKLDYLPDREFRGRVTYIYPTVDEKTRTAKVRMEFHNPGYFLKPGMFATVQVTSELDPSALLVPNMAILRSGEKTTVFVALDGGKFDPRTVTLGPEAEGDMYQVLSGLKEGERIVTSGQFMLDSESQLREAIQKMLAPKVPVARAPMGVQSTAGPAAQASMPAPGPMETAAFKYICPMPEHVSIQYDNPGKCPICGMTLVPVSSATLRKLPPAGKLLYYTCPMPEHSDVHIDKPGKCPKCGMTLIPVMEALPIPEPRAALDAIPVTLYTCPMEAHADVVSDKPGKCPKCEMDLVPTGTVSHGKLAEENWRKQHQPTGHISHGQQQ
jgi:multidrug efflux pump subunit AcrA (membrane-fusion protein)